MYHTLLGAAGFRKGMDLYFRRHDGQAVTCDDFLAAMADANDADLEQFALWYSQAGTPEISVGGHYDAAARTYELTLGQTLPASPDGLAKQPMQIPIAVGLLDADGSDLPLDGEGATTKVLQLRQGDAGFRFENIPAPPVPSVNRDFSAPVRLRHDPADAERAFLMAHDADPFNRWEAGQQYASKLLLSMTRSVADGGEAVVDQRFVAALGKLLGEDGLDQAFIALACQLPGEQYLAEQLGDADPGAIHRAREALRRGIAEGLKDELAAVYRGNRANAPYSPDAAAAGQRALRNLALSYLSLLDDPGCRDLAPAQYRDADNMTDRMAALWAMNDRDGEDRAAALADFHDRFKDDAVVID
ncbi:MAG: DUF3458 domain-containing protein, partial [Alphaproteobacteria bacterium]|nr:DUF3458 domain-containing protein [Alphaproteobacteria bacterium]